MEPRRVRMRGVRAPTVEPRTPRTPLYGGAGWGARSAGPPPRADAPVSHPWVGEGWSADSGEPRPGRSRPLAGQQQAESEAIGSVVRPAWAVLAVVARSAPAGSVALMMAAVARCLVGVTMAGR
jgi:hypothetical protein